eukprot:TRINITY_DN8494_c0_g1_i1.p1 TRINITY_DN8494_c0_g1~~TRINITY_DN8494_c0_g1_i1.p1  ORF type:complete len:391 (+),score=51.86 TRINITY_DN8494_c0_g1_i1:351-1523(+)
MADSLKKMFATLKQYFVMYPKAKNLVLAASKKLQDQAKEVIMATKAAPAVIRFDEADLAVKTQNLVRAVYAVFCAVEGDSLPSAADIIRLVQWCAQYSMKILHVVFGASDESLDIVATSAVLGSEKLYRYLEIKSGDITNFTTSQTLISSSKLIESKVSVLKMLAQQYMAEKNDTELENKLKIEAKLAVNEFRKITILVKEISAGSGTGTTGAAPPGEASTVVEGAITECRSLITETSADFADETLVAPEMQPLSAHLAQCKQQLDSLQLSVYLKNDASALQAFGKGIGDSVWAINTVLSKHASLWDSPGAEEGEVGLKGQCEVYLKGMRFYSHLLKIVLASKCLNICVVDEANPGVNVAHFGIVLKGLVVSIVLLLRTFQLLLLTPKHV